MTLNSIKRWAAAWGLAAGLAACGGGGSAPPPATPPAGNGEAATSSYQLGSGDRVRVTVFRHPDLSGEFALDGAGNFAMPLVGEIQAYGLTTRALEARIEQKLEDGLLVEPQVAVEVLTYRPFYILGEVNRPGSYPYVSGMTVLKAVALAGGFSYRAKENSFLLQRGGSNSGSLEVSGDAGLLPGDIITVQERWF